MDWIKTIFFLLIGFVLLIKSSDIFVDAVSSIATHFKMSKMMIALTVAAFGTCAPELAISFNSISSGQGDIALANVLGSNVINIVLIIGLAAVVSPIVVKRQTVKKELPILVVLTSIFALLLATHYLDQSTLFILTRTDGFIFITGFVIFIIYLISVIRTKENIKEKSTPKYNMFWSITLTILCCVLIVFASDIVVDNATYLAEMANVSTKIITMTIVVIGTSLPEMTMTVIASKKGEFDIAIGNIIGTNIFNIGVVLGLPLLVFGGITSPHFNLIDILAVLVAAFVFYLFSKNDRVLTRKEGIIMISIFALYYIYLFLQ